MKPVSIIMGSDSDYEKMKGAMEQLDALGVGYEVEVVSAHRTPKKMQTYATGAHKKGIKVIIAGAGGAAHLPGMVASLTHLPVIGVPITATNMEGLDALLSIAQMPKGVPVATMAVDNSTNAGLLAARILGLSKKGLTQKLIDFQKTQQKKVAQMNKNLKSKK